MAIKSGVITVATAGTAVQGPAVGGTFIIKALAANTGLIYLGDDGNNDVSSTTGFELSGGDQIVIEANSLANWWFDTSVSGGKACWVKVGPAE